MALIITYDSTPRSPICFPVYLEGKYKLAAKMDGKEAISEEMKLEKIHFFLIYGRTVCSYCTRQKLQTIKAHINCGLALISPRWQSWS